MINVWFDVVSSSMINVLSCMFCQSEPWWIDIDKTPKMPNNPKWWLNVDKTPKMANNPKWWTDIDKTPKIASAPSRVLLVLYLF